MGDVGAANHIAWHGFRFAKPNNRKELVSDKFYRCYEKGYSDNHIMSMKTYKEIGEYNYELGKVAESDYMKRCFAKGYRKYFYKYPVAFFNDDCYRLLKPIPYSKYEKEFKNFPNPVSNEQLINYAARKSAI